MSSDVERKEWFVEIGECWEVFGIKPNERSKIYRKNAAKHRGLEKLEKDQSVYRICANFYCVRPEHLSVSSQGKPTWITLNQDLFWERFNLMKSQGRTRTQHERREKKGKSWKEWQQKQRYEEELNSGYQTAMMK